tara:strand:- start:2438 stop:3079 length:642 start_codon:yes stop_codon:yes gene_type:complete
MTIELLKEHSKFQEIVVTEDNGIRSLYLDGDLQFNDINEKYFHNAFIDNLENYSSIKDTNVCIIGGGDGGCVRNLLSKKPKSITLIEIDSKVIDVSIKYFPNLNDSGNVFKKVNVVNQNAFDYFKKSTSFNSVLFDVTVPEDVSLSKSLFTYDFFKSLNTKYVNFFISHNTINNFDYHLFRLFKDYKTYNIFVPGYTNNSLIGVVAEVENLYK